MKTPSSHFTDDSSSAIGLDHRAESGTLSGSLSSSGGIKSFYEKQRIEAERHDREALERRTAEIREESKTWGDNPEGCTIEEARKKAQWERDHPVEPGKQQDHEGAKRRFVEHLMRPPVTPKGGGSKSSRRKTAKKGTWICGECGLEWCEHRPVRSKGGRVPKDGQARRVRERVRLSDLTLTELEGLGLSSSDALALFAVAYKEKRPLDDVISEFKKANGYRTRSEKLSATA